MANCSYLYASPSVPNRKKVTPFKGLSEWVNDIPLSHKIMVSVDTQYCTSTIWDTDDKIALCGNYSSGYQRLLSFIKQINYEPLQEPIEDTIAFLSAPENIQKFAVIEPLEIFEFFDEAPTFLTTELMKALGNIDNEIQRVLSILNNSNSPSDEVEETMHYLGLHNWTEILYYDFSEREQSSVES
jgi:hypothetical protein